MSHPAADLPASIAPAFAALGDETRLGLFSRLTEGPARSIVDLTRGTGLTRQGVAKHLAVLERAGLVASERVGRENRYAVRTEKIDEARRFLDRASRQWDDAIGRLRGQVED